MKVIWIAIEHILMAIISWLLWLVLFLLLQNNSQQEQFMSDREFYISGITSMQSWINEINWKIDKQNEKLFSTIEKTIDEKLNNWFNCEIVWY